jgi:hypothetical protein
MKLGRAKIALAAIEPDAAEVIAVVEVTGADTAAIAADMAAAKTAGNFCQNRER